MSGSSDECFKEFMQIVFYSEIHLRVHHFTPFPVDIMGISDGSSFG